MPTLGVRGERLDLLLKQGSTLGPFPVEMKTGENPVVLSGCTVRASIRKDFSSVTSYAITCTLTDAANGKFSFTMTDEQTAVVPYLGDMRSPENQYVWDLEIEMVDGTVLPVFYGKVKVAGEVTK